MSDAYKQGYLAYVAGEYRTGNPFSDSQPEFQDYDDGWLWARQCDDGEERSKEPN